MRGPLSEETKRKIGDAHRGRKASDETRLKLSEARKGQRPWIAGKKHTAAAIEKMKGTWFKKGHQISDNCRRALRARRGIPRPAFSAEWRANISRGQLGRRSPMKGKRFSEAARLNMRLAQHKRVLGKRGEGTPRWIADRSKLKTSRAHAYDTQYKYWMMTVKRRDGWKCRIADDNCKGRLEAHHILGWKSYPELRYQPNNGITLCHHHHPRTRKGEMELSPYFQKLVAEAA
jgi:hypothetical protein